MYRGTISKKSCIINKRTANGYLKNQKLNIKSQNDNVKIKMAEKTDFKKEFKNRLYKFSLQLINFIDKLPQDNVSRRLGDQLLRSGTSILGNYIEGQSASSKKDFINFFNHSLKSANESKIWISLIRDSKRANKDSVDWFLKELNQIANIFASSILTLKGKR